MIVLCREINEGRKLNYSVVDNERSGKLSEIHEEAEKMRSMSPAAIVYTASPASGPSLTPPTSNYYYMSAGPASLKPYLPPLSQQLHV